MKDEKEDVLELPMPKSPVARSFICTFGNEASLVRGACSVKLNDVDDDSYDSSIAHSSERIQKRKICAQKALGLLLTAQRALKREKYRLTRLLAPCPQLRELTRERNMGSQGSCPLAHSTERSRERNIGSQGFWPLAHSSESIRKRPQFLTKQC